MHGGFIPFSVNHTGDSGMMRTIRKVPDSLFIIPFSVNHTGYSGMMRTMRKFTEGLYLSLSTILEILV
jgi:hypothetical protein